MKKAELTKIIKFIESEIHGYDIDFDYEIENETVTVKLNGSFTNNQTIEIEFSLSELDREIHFYSISECWSIAETEYENKMEIGINKNEEDKLIEFVEPKHKEIIIKDKGITIGKIFISRYNLKVLNIKNEEILTLYPLSKIKELDILEEIDIFEFERLYKNNQRKGITKLRYGIGG